MNLTNVENFPTPLIKREKLDSIKKQISYVTQSNTHRKIQ